MLDRVLISIFGAAAVTAHTDCFGLINPTLSLAIPIFGTPQPGPCSSGWPAASSSPDTWLPTCSTNAVLDISSSKFPGPKRPSSAKAPPLLLNGQARSRARPVAGPHLVWMQRPGGPDRGCSGLWDLCICRRHKIMGYLAAVCVTVCARPCIIEEWWWGMSERDSERVSERASERGREN